MKLAGVFADLHLCHTPPSCRESEPDWYLAMERSLRQVKEIIGDLPIFCAGDIFDRSDPPPSLINFALDVLPTMYTVPGQHDLPWHGVERMHACAYGTLLRSGRIHDLTVESFDGFVAVGYGWNEEFEPVAKPQSDLYLAIVHHYCWIRGRKHPGALPAGNAKVLGERLKGFDIAVFGDNHIPFQIEVGDTTVYNCGSLMRRTVDQEEYRPSVGIIHDDGTIERVFLSTAGECFEGRQQSTPVTSPLRSRIGRIIRHLASEQEAHSLDYKEAVRQYANGLRDTDVADFMREVIDGVGL